MLLLTVELCARDRLTLPLGRANPNSGRERSSLGKYASLARRFYAPNTGDASFAGALAA